MRLTIQAIIRWEQLRNKPFPSMDYSDKEDVAAILYVTNNDYKYSFEVFKCMIEGSESLFKKLIRELESEISLSAQFQDKFEGKEAGDPVFVKDIIPSLIFSGLDADFVLNKMPYYDLPAYIEAYGQKKREEMENSRLWTYLSILPHITKKIEIKDFLPFPWEEEEEKKEAERNSKKNEEMFELFMKNGLNIPK